MTNLNRTPAAGVIPRAHAVGVINKRYITVYILLALSGDFAKLLQPAIKFGTRADHKISIRKQSTLSFSFGTPHRICSHYIVYHAVKDLGSDTGILI